VIKYLNFGFKLFLFLFVRSFVCSFVSLEYSVQIDNAIIFKILRALSKRLVRLSFTTFEIASNFPRHSVITNDLYTERSLRTNSCLLLQSAPI
jgi:hypothetical protein